MSTTQQFFTTREDAGYTVVEFQTDSLMNPQELEQVGQSLYNVVDDSPSRRYLLDFSKVKYLSSQAIGMVVALNKKLMGQTDAGLVLCGVGPQLLQLLKITRLDRVFKIAKTAEDATAV